MVEGCFREAGVRGGSVVLVRAREGESCSPTARAAPALQHRAAAGVEPDNTNILVLHLHYILYKKS